MTDLCSQRHSPVGKKSMQSESVAGPAQPLSYFINQNQ
jgi:hypothetical protein